MILITGGGGFIGLNLARHLVDRGEDVLLVRRHVFEVPAFLARHVGKQVTIARADISEPAVLYSVLKAHDVESIVHAAVVTETSEGSSLYQAIKVNLQGTAEILEAARIFGLRRVTFLSSVSVYFPFGEDVKVLGEDNPLPATSPEWISGTKKAGEQICQLYAQQYGMSIPIVRPPQVWGPLYWTRRSPVHAMMENAVLGQATDLSGIDGGQKSSYVYVRDCAKAISLVHLAPSLEHGIYNISDGEGHSLAEFAAAVKAVIPGALIKLGNTRGPRDMAAPPMSIGRIKSELGFTPDYDLKRAVKAYIAWLRDGEYL